MGMRIKGLSISLVAMLALTFMLPANPLSAQSATAPANQPRDELAGKLSRRIVQRAPLSVPGREMVQVATEIPPGVESGWHTHPGEEVGYIVAGNIVMKVAGRPDVTLHAGDGFLIPPGTPHNAHDLGPETGQMLSTYIVEPGQPLAMFVQPHAEK